MGNGGQRGREAEAARRRKLIEDWRLAPDPDPERDCALMRVARRRWPAQCQPTLELNPKLTLL